MVKNLNRKSAFIAVKVIFILLILVQAFALALGLTKFTAYAETIHLDKLIYRFNPATNGSLGTRFNVTVVVEDVEDMAVFQVCIVYNDTLINVTRWFEPRWDSEYVFHGEGTLPVPAPPEYEYVSIAKGNGSAMVGAALFPEPSPGGGFTGDGILCIMEFNITAVPPANKTYTTELALNKQSPLDSFVLDVPGDEIPVTKESSYYEIIPEFHPLLILPIFIAITFVALALAKKGIRKSKVYTAPVNN